ncbi:MAG: hypothetical protein R3A47_06475 [Polyangiales bacterium]
MALPSLALRNASLILIVAYSASTGCGGGSPDPLAVTQTCVDYCAFVSAQCHRFSGIAEDECQQACERDRADALANSNACADAFDAGFNCVTSLDDCELLDSWIAQEPTDSYPCRDANIAVQAACDPTASSSFVAR